MNKKIFIFNDGTSQYLESEFISNVAKLYKSLPGSINLNSALRCDEHKEDKELNYQVLYYRGVGANELRKEGVEIEAPKNFREYLGLLWARFLLWANKKSNVISGASIVARIEAVLDDLEKIWQPGDKVYFVGFSRGASSARIAAHYLSKTLPNLEIEYLLVFDTVYSVFNPITVRSFEQIKCFDNRDIGMHIKKCDHLISGDEMREKFPLTPVNLRAGVRQILFSGCHSDVGGGLNSNKLSDISLSFAINEFQSLGIQFDQNIVKSLKISPDPTGIVGWDRFGGTAQTHFPRDFKDVEFKIHQSVAIRVNHGGSVPIALAQLGKFEFGTEEFLDPNDTKVTFKPLNKNSNHAPVV